MEKYIGGILRSSRSKGLKILRCLVIFLNRYVDRYEFEEIRDRNYIEISNKESATKFSRAFHWARWRYVTEDGKIPLPNTIFSKDYFKTEGKAFKLYISSVESAKKELFKKELERKRR